MEIQPMTTLTSCCTAPVGSKPVRNPRCTSAYLLTILLWMLIVEIGRQGSRHRMAGYVELQHNSPTLFHVKGFPVLSWHSLSVHANHSMASHRSDLSYQSHSLDNHLKHYSIYSHSMTMWEGFSLRQSIRRGTILMCLYSWRPPTLSWIG